MNQNNPNAMLKWLLKKEQLTNILQREEAQELLKGPVTVVPMIMTWGWGASVELKGSDVSVMVPYYQEEVVRPEFEIEQLNQMNHHLTVQTFLLEELIKELKDFMMERYGIDVSVHK